MAAPDIATEEATGEGGGTRHEIASEDHVALGTDFDGGAPLPRGMRDFRDVGRIRKFMGENLLRVFRQITDKDPNAIDWPTVRPIPH